MTSPPLAAQSVTKQLELRPWRLPWRTDSFKYECAHVLARAGEPAGSAHAEVACVLVPKLTLEANWDSRCNACSGCARMQLCGLWSFISVATLRSISKGLGFGKKSLLLWQLCLVIHLGSRLA